MQNFNIPASLDSSAGWIKCYLVTIRRQAFSNLPTALFSSEHLRTERAVVTAGGDDPNVKIY